jgi:TolA-binding protein
MPTTPPCPDPARRRRALAAALLVALASSGCSAGIGPMARWRMAHDEVISRPPSTDEVGDDRGPLARLFTPERAPKTVDTEVAPVSLPAPTRPDPETDAEFRSAVKMLREGKLAEAERILAKLDRRKNGGVVPVTPGRIGLDSDNSSGRLGLFGGARKRQTALGEEVLYYLAESQYRQGKLVAAEKSYATLAVTYPGSEHIPKVAAAEYAIAMEWLASLDPDAPTQKRATWADRINGYLPPIDVQNHALMVLEHVRHHDPKGPLADDAVKKIADFHFENGNYEEASVYYDELIEHYPKSPLLLGAFVGSINSKLKGYMGPGYDGSGLTQARDLIRRATSTFPERDQATSDFLARSLDLINDQEAEIAFRRGEFYRRTGYPQAAELSYGEVRARWPQSEWAKKSQDQLALIAKAPRKAVLPSKIMTTPGSPDPYGDGLGSGSMMNSPGGNGSPTGGIGP